ncbi:uncharacterized protein M421DRAFT_64734 [Didymella exigua CBS 183.55]|uniref:Uncharacterized protein n=1 Tax=Didymella exigua CBS 183.55 TaxID=1150837 RepID=A0A6A5RQ18_9PLEO|nr:uncharacterized protein M421DRAFT_64734 [Didymella exigua CBS 183.55]KAF1927587.1 hypothetical protein M421DRAFT_64734 [Didymella exigua CBS 183.55]
MSCELSPSAAAFGTMLSAFIGSVVNGLCSGALIAFITGWISWLSVIRILIAGAYELYLTIKAGTNFDAVNTEYKNIPLSAVGEEEGGRGESTALNNTAESQTNLPSSKPSHSSSSSKLPMLGKVDQSVGVFGWLGWTWSAVYTPISQTIWVCVHLTSASSGINQCVRALAIGVSALSLTFDYKARYGAVLGRKWGAWAFVAFNAWNAGACLLLGLEALVLLIHGATRIENMPIPLVVIYPIFCIIWAAVSWRFLPPIDGGRPSNVIAGVLMGAFAGLFVAGPAFALWRNAEFDREVAKMMGQSASKGLGLGDFLACESASVWAKFAAVMP